jgi:CO/xanthine dehydrogenase Mo-binding subunit
VEGPFGAKGIGEPPVVPPPAAIANAIYHAAGVRMTSLPITPEKVRRALREREQAGGE